jgi:3'-phosphoadenosine 5'-phosphosulfate sulfotransferase (PAPS reductase)/FAD synthetase
MGEVNEDTAKRVVVWFSCGAASAVAAKMAIADYPELPVVLAYTDPGSEHPDSKRFLDDCEKWLNHRITILKSDRYNSTWEVWEKARYVGGIAGAPCTGALKKGPREAFEDFDDLQVFGYTAEETHRADRFREQNPHVMLDTPLIRHGLGKGDCLAMIERAGIELPQMYQLGFKNNNCIPCSKAKSVGYWRLIREHFPEEFERYAKLCDELGVKQIEIAGERRSLKDLDQAGPGKYEPEDIECSLLCHIAETNI